MLTTLYFSLAFLGLTLLALGLWLGWRVRQIRSGALTVRPEAAGELAALLQPAVDLFYAQFANLFKQAVRFITFACLLIAHELVVFSKYIMARLENRFFRLMSLVRGRPILEKNGAVSLFLSEITYQMRRE